MEPVTVISSDSSDASTTSSSDEEGATIFQKPKQRPKTKQPSPTQQIKQEVAAAQALAPRSASQSAKKRAGLSMEVPHSIQRMQEQLQGSSPAPTALPSSVSAKRKSNATSEPQISKRARSLAAVEVEVASSKCAPSKAQRRAEESTAFTRVNGTISTATQPNGVETTTPASARVPKPKKRQSKEMSDIPELESQLTTNGSGYQPTKSPQQNKKSTTMPQRIEEIRNGDLSMVEDLEPPLEGDAKIEALQREIEDMKAAVKDVVKYGGMLTAHDHGKLGGAIQVLKAKLQFIWGD